jgi:hypothetical protein
VPTGKAGIEIVPDFGTPPRRQIAIAPRDLGQSRVPGGRL